MLRLLLRPRLCLRCGGRPGGVVVVSRESGSTDVPPPRSVVVACRRLFSAVTAPPPPPPSPPPPPPPPEEPAGARFFSTAVSAADVVASAVGDGGTCAGMTIVANLPAPALAELASHLAATTEGSEDLSTWPAKEGAVLEAIAEATRHRLDQFESADLARVSVALAAAGVLAAKPALARCLAAAALKNLSVDANFSGKDLARLSWAFASSPVVAAPRCLYGALARAAFPRVAELDAGDLAATTYALATRRVNEPLLYMALARRASAVSYDRRGRVVVAPLAWALAQAGAAQPPRDLLEKFASLLDDDDEAGDATTVSVLTWLCARAGHGDLVDRLVDRALLNNPAVAHRRWSKNDLDRLDASLSAPHSNNSGATNLRRLRTLAARGASTPSPSPRPTPSE